MYQPPAFKETRKDVLFNAIAKHSLATLVCNSVAGITANHLPMIADTGQLNLQAHLSRGNDLIQMCDEGTEALAIFQGPAHYVSAGWYPGKKDHGKEVPTFNYVVVHVRGKLRFKRDETWLMQHLHALTDKMERNQVEPWSLSDAPKDYLARQLKGIYGLELEIDEIVGKWKVSQNRNEQDRSAVAKGLQSEGDQDALEIAKLIS